MWHSTNREDAPLDPHFISAVKIIVPIVDASVSALLLGMVLSKDGRSTCKDPADRKNELSLQKAQEASPLAVWASSSASPFATVVVLWADEFLQNLNPVPVG